MQDDTGAGFDIVDDDELDAVLVEDETGVEERVPQDVAFDFALSDAGPAVDLGREAVALGYDVEIRQPDDADGYYEVTCSRRLHATPAGVARARRELEAIAEEVGCVDDDEEHEDPGTE